MKHNFSFKYDGKEITAASLNAGVCEVSKDVFVTLTERKIEGYDASEWLLYFENKSDKISGIFSDILDCDTLFPLTYPRPRRNGYVPVDGDACVITMNGIGNCKYYWNDDKVSAREFALNKEYLDNCVVENTKTFENIRGLSSNELMPFFDVTANGEGYFVAIGWTGSWRATFVKCDDGIHAKMGLQETKFYLEPGEKIRTASIMVLKYEKGEDKYNKIRRFIKENYSHKAAFPEKKDGVMAYSVWGGLPSKMQVERLAELKKSGAKFEEYWIDAAWYGNCQKCEEEFSGDWGDHTGEWTPNPKVHPNELMDVKAAAEDAGLRFMLWLEPERAITGTRVMKEHPEWFITLPDNTSNMLWYGNEEALEYTCKLLSEKVEKYNLSVYRQDFNVQIEDYCKQNDTENRIGITEIKHIMGMYRVWDYLLSKYPHLIIDNCCGGGRRIDIETLRRSIPVCRTDFQVTFNTNPEALQVQTTNISKYFPFNGCQYRNSGDTYVARSSYSSSWAISPYGCVFQEMDDEKFAWLKTVSEEYRRIRRYFSEDYYNHASCTFDDTGWTVWQYHDPKDQSGIIMAFRRSNCVFDTIPVNLCGLVDGKKYEVLNIDTEEAFEITDSLEITLPEKRSSVIFEYKMK